MERKVIKKKTLEYDFGLVDLELKINDKIVDIGAGKYHSLFLTGIIDKLWDSGDVYCIGVNRFGQLGDTNLKIAMSGEPIKLEFPKVNTKIEKIAVGDNHNLMLTTDGELYGNGDNSAGQVDGDLENFLYYYCTPKLITLPTEGPIERLFAKNNRSAVILNNIAYYWGGFSYNPKYLLNSLPKYDGINSFNTENGIPENAIIKDIGLGFLHDIILVK